MVNNTTTLPGPHGDSALKDTPNDLHEHLHYVKDDDLAAKPYVWMAYLAYTLLLLVLLAISFIHYHYKNRDKYKPQLTAQ